MDIKQLLNDGYVVICDTNVYLHIYKYSPEFSDFALRCMETVYSSIVMPSTVRYEFTKNQRSYYSKMKSRVQKVANDAERKIEDAKRKVLGNCVNLMMLQYPDVEDLKTQLNGKFDELIIMVNSFFSDRPVLNYIADLW